MYYNGAITLVFLIRSMSTISFFEDGATEGHSRPSVRMENTYQLKPRKRFPSHQVKLIIKEVLEGYLSEEKYEAELCRQMTKTISEVSVCNSKLTYGAGA